MTLAQQLINVVRAALIEGRVMTNAVQLSDAEIGDVEEDEPYGSPEWSATLDAPCLWTFMLEANGRTLRVMVEDVTPHES